MDMKQRIADGIAQWLREEAPVTVQMSMERKHFNNLLQTICNQFTADDFEQTRDALAQWAAAERSNDADELANARAERDRIINKQT
jgi:hypothetical protein